MHKFASRFAPADQVIIDKDPSIIATVTAVTFTGTTGNYYDICWFSNGCQQNIRVDEWRISPANA